MSLGAILGAGSCVLCPLFVVRLKMHIMQGSRLSKGVRMARISVQRRIEGRMFIRTKFSNYGAMQNGVKSYEAAEQAPWGTRCNRICVPCHKALRELIGPHLLCCRPLIPLPLYKMS